MRSMDVTTGSVYGNVRCLLRVFCTVTQVPLRALVKKHWNVACIDPLALFVLFLLILFSTASGSK